MEQIDMCKNSQEVIQKNNETSKKLFKTKTIGLAADKNVKITIKYVPTLLPANSNPSYNFYAVETNK